MIRIAPLACVAALALAAIAPPVSAQTFVLHEGVSTDPAVRVSQTRLNYADLDLATAAGARELFERIEAAADAVCAGAKPSELETCRSAAIAGAAAKVSSPAFSVLTARRATEQTARR